MVLEALDLGITQVPVDRGTVTGADEAVDQLIRPVEALPNPLDLVHRRSRNPMTRYPPLFRLFDRPSRESVRARADDALDGVYRVPRRLEVCPRHLRGR